MYFAQNRFYDAANHRFTQEDPIQDGWNWYAYCEDNPGVNVDPWGLYYLLKLKDGSYKAGKQSEFDAVLQAFALNWSIQSSLQWFVGTETVGGSSHKEADIDGYVLDMAMSGASDYIDQVIVPHLQATHPYLAAGVSLLNTFGGTIYTWITAVPPNISIANRDDYIWKVFAVTGISPTSWSLSVLKERMVKVDEFVKQAEPLFSKKINGINMTLFDAGKILKSGNANQKNSLKTKMKNTFYPNFVYEAAFQYYQNLSYGKTASRSFYKTYNYTTWNNGQIKTTATNWYNSFQDEYIDIIINVYDEIIDYFNSVF